MKVTIILLLMVACGKHDPPAEDHGDIIGDGKFLISADNHPQLFAQTNCFMCHQEFSIHTKDRIESLDIDLEYIQTRVEDDGINSCQECHGDYGN